MDVVLEVFDTFLFDRIYANVLPAAAPALKAVRDSLNLRNASSYATLTSLREAPTPVGWEFQPASEFISFAPSQYAFESSWARDNIFRQAMSLFLITWLFGIVIYFVCATLSYVFVFDKTTFQHPKYLKNQMSLEMQQSLRAFPVMAIFTTPFFLAEVRGYSKIYDTMADCPYGSWYLLAQIPFFIAFTDCFIYFIHRGLHHPRVYKTLHKPHHKWIMPTPYASHAFHPIDGFAQSVPYHVFPFLFPLQKFSYIALFVFINVWTVMIHDGEYISQSVVVNGAACHTMHHLYFNYNYGQFTTLWDRLGNSYRKPNEELFKRETKMSKKEWESQSKEMETIVKEVEGEDDRSYLPDEDGKKTQ